MHSVKIERKLLEREGDIIGKNFLWQHANLPLQNAKWKRHVNKITLKMYEKQIRYRNNKYVI